MTPTINNSLCLRFDIGT